MVAMTAEPGRLTQALGRILWSSGLTVSSILMDMAAFEVVPFRHVLAGHSPQLAAALEAVLQRPTLISQLLPRELGTTFECDRQVQAALLAKHDQLPKGAAALLAANHTIVRLLVGCCAPL